MDYVALLAFRPSVIGPERDAALMRRAAWQYPEGITPIAEYWPSVAGLQVVTIFSATEYAPVMELLYEWNDVFEIKVYPAVSAQDGLAIGPEVFAKLNRLQQ